MMECSKQFLDLALYCPRLKNNTEHFNPELLYTSLD